MFSRCFTATTQGIEAYTVEIETHVEAHVPGFAIVGLPDSAVRESKERVLSAMKNSAIPFDTNRKITINLAPADIRKEGSSFDLPIAMGMLATGGVVDSDKLKEYVMLGELALDGTLRPVRGALNVALHARKMREKFPELKSMIVPAANAGEAGLVKEMNVYAVTTLREAVDLMNGLFSPEPVHVDIEKIFREDSQHTHFDFAEVKGQEAVKRALEVAAAGGHNLIMVAARPARAKVC